MQAAFGLLALGPLDTVRCVRTAECQVRLRHGAGDEICDRERHDLGKLEVVNVDRPPPARKRVKSERKLE
eukprot:12420063-Heterocapsa_arctica.AAC.1